MVMGNVPIKVNIIKWSMRSEYTNCMFCELSGDVKCTLFHFQV